MHTRTRQTILAGAFLLGLGLTVARPALGQKDAGLAAQYPWSGYWWQHKGGGLTGPLSKYDQVFHTAASAWEYQKHVQVATLQWFGHCHAWAASSVLEREPRASRSVGSIVFGVGDQKGLLAACHAADVSNSYGDRYGDHAGSEDRNDIHPDELWRLLQLYVHQQRIPLILDLEAGEEIWNYPVYQYEVEYAAEADGWQAGTMTLVAADDNVVPDYVGTQYIVRRYTFRVQFKDGALVLGTGQWTGPSVQDHPDFAWYPFVAAAENPDVDVDKVEQVVGYNVGGGATPPSADNPVAPNPAPPEPNNPPQPEPSPGPGGKPPANRGVQPIDLDRIVDPYELVTLVTNKTSAFPLDLFIDQGDGGRYIEGQPIRISVRSGQAGYLYLFDLPQKGDLRLVYPKAGQPNQIEADTQYDFPAAQEPAPLVAQAPGRHDLKGIVTSSPIRITGSVIAPPSQLQQQIAPATTRKPGPGQQPAAQTAAQPGSIVLPPTTQAQVTQLARDGLNKGSDTTKPEPKKYGRFAQDMCVYFVQAPATKPGKTRTQQVKAGE